MLDLVRSHMATVLGLPTVESVAPDMAFAELGFDSLTAVELRNRLKAATGLALSPTLIFDYPNPYALAGYFRTSSAARRRAGPHAEPARRSCCGRCRRSRSSGCGRRACSRSC